MIKGQLRHRENIRHAIYPRELTSEYWVTAAKVPNVSLSIDSCVLLARCLFPVCDVRIDGGDGVAKRKQHDCQGSKIVIEQVKYT